MNSIQNIVYGLRHTDYGGLNLAGMNVEDVAQLLMLLVTQDSRRDLNELKAEMEAARRAHQPQTGPDNAFGLQPRATGPTVGQVVGIATVGAVLAVVILGALNALRQSAAPIALTAPPPPPALNLPPDGTSMAWIDGSSLIGIACDGHSSRPEPHFHWLYLNEVSTDMYMLCVEAGACSTPPEMPEIMPEIMPIGIVGPDRAQDYCLWAGGRFLSQEEMLEIRDNSSIEDLLHGPDDILFGDGSVIPADDLLMGFRCSVDAPHAMSPMCQTTAFYMDGAPPPMAHGVQQAGQFCQSGQSFATGDILMPEGATIDTFSSSSCGVAEGNRFYCQGPSGGTGQGEVSLVCNGLDPELSCPAGYASVGDVNLDPGVSSYNDLSHCSFTGGVREGCVAGTTAMPLEGGGFYCGPQQTSSAGSGNLALVVYPLQDAPTPMCLPGMYFDPELNACVSPGPYDDACLQGFEFNDALGCCTAGLPTGRYPGCPAGVALDPATGMCDFENVWQEGGGVLHTLEYSLAFPDCSESGGGGEGSGGDCPAGMHFSLACVCCVPD